MKPFFPATTFFILIAVSSAYPETITATPPLVKQKKCDNCHRFSPITEKTSIKAPNLFYAGNKFQKKWLRKYLQNPTPIRKAGYITDPGFLLGKPIVAQPHVSLSKEEVEVMTSYLLSLKIANLPVVKLDNKQLSKDKKAKAKIFFERNYGCTSCHQAINLAKKVRGGISGPSLVDAGNRLQPDWVFQWLHNPKQFESTGRMPLYDFSNRNEDLLLLTKYILTLKKETLR